MSFRKVGIYGVGLIGGSVGLALKKAGAEVLGIGRNPDKLKRAVSVGAIDDFSTSIDSALGVDVLVIAVPVGVILEKFDVWKKLSDSGIIITDAGSTKKVICDKVEEKEVNLFVPSHPIAGSEKTGVENARADLFHNKTVIITPASVNPDETVEVVKKLWESVGGKVKFMSAEHHDKVLALTSHLPHILSFATANLISELESEGIYVRGNFAGSLTDILRVADASPVMWRDIFDTNRDNLKNVLERFKAILGRFLGNPDDVESAVRKAGLVKKELLGE